VCDYKLASQRCLFVRFSDCSLILDALFLSCISLVVLRVHHHNRYDGELKKAQEVGVKQGLIQGIGMGVTMMLVFFVDGLAFWFVGHLCIDCQNRYNMVCFGVQVQWQACLRRGRKCS
jgi:hypothetical protein